MDLDPKKFRTIVFVRHGQYDRNPEKLTALGRTQAKLVAKSLKSLKPLKLYCSTMPRAQETAQIIGAAVQLSPRSRAFFREGILPGTVDFFNLISNSSSKTEKTVIKKKMKSAKQNADKAFKYLFDRSVRGAPCEIVVAHGNVIRYWVCKALKIDEKKWTSLDVIHSSITTIRIDDKGHCVLLGFSDCGHLPHKMKTYV